MDSDTGRQLDGQDVLARVSEGVLILDRELDITYANPRAFDILGEESEAVVGHNLWDVFPYAEETVAGERIESALAANEEATYERYNAEIGRWVDVRIYPNSDGVTLFFRDITERKEREKELERYEHIIENLPVAVGQNVADDHDQFTYVNETMVEMFDGESKAAVKSHAVEEIYADDERRHEILQRLKAEDTIEGAEARFETFSGDEFWGALTASLDTEADETEFVGVLEDISDRKEREQRIRNLHEATRELLHSETREKVAERTSATASDIIGFHTNGVHLYDASVDGLVPTAVSEKCREVMGEPPVLTEGLAWEAFKTGESAVFSDVRELDAVYNDATPMRSEMFLPLGNQGILIVSATAVDAFNPEDVALAKLLANNAGAVLGQIEREERLRARERQLQRAETLFENAQDAFFLINVDQSTATYTIERVNPAYESLTGLSSDEIEGEPIESIYGTDAQTLREHYDRCVATEEKLEYVEQLAVPSPDSYWETRLAPVVVDGEVVQIAGATRNITDRKAYEQQLEEQRDRLELLNQMVRHDIRNNLQVISSYAELLDNRIEGDETEYIERILTNAETAVELTRTARDLSGTMLQTDTNTEPVPVRSVLLSQIDEIRTSYTDAIVTLDNRVPSVAVTADDMLSSVFRNIIKNAIQHNDTEHPEVTITVAATADRVRISVADNGPGVPDEQKNEIFGKGEKGLESEGTGIGLYLVNTLVERYGGSIHVHDNEPEGTIVTITLDRA